MCFPNSPAAIKAVAAFCFCVNMFNLIYLFMRYHELLPPDAVLIRQEMESIMPDVKNLDKYLAPRDGTIFLSTLAGISVAFDFILYVGVEQQQPGLILSAWMWGVIDCSLDAAIGIASGNLTFMDSFSREPKTTPVTESADKSLILYRKMYGNTTTQQTTPTTIIATDDEGPRSNDTEYFRARKATVYRKVYGNSIMMREMLTTSAISPHAVYDPSQNTLQVVTDISAANTTLYRLTLIALAGIKDYASQVIIQRQKQYLEMTQETTMKDSTEATTQHSAHGSTASMPSEQVAPNPGHAPHASPPHPAHERQPGHYAGSPGIAPHVPPPYLSHEHERAPRTEPPGFAPHVLPPYPSYEHERGNQAAFPEFAPHVPPPQSAREHGYGPHPAPPGFKV